MLSIFIMSRFFSNICFN